MTVQERWTRTADPRERESRHDELVALYRWHRDWSVTARALIHQKRPLMALGLAAPKRGDEDSEDLDADE